MSNNKNEKKKTNLEKKNLENKSKSYRAYL